jgi:hypothetical protein
MFKVTFSDPWNNSEPMSPVIKILPLQVGFKITTAFRSDTEVIYFSFRHFIIIRLVSLAHGWIRWWSQALYIGISVRRSWFWCE